MRSRLSARPLIARWSDASGSHQFKMDGFNPAAPYSSNCSNFTPSGPQSLDFHSAGSFDGATDNASLSNGDYEGPSSTSNPDTVQFALNTPEGTLMVYPFSPLPLQGAPGRVQPFGPPVAT